MDWVGPQTTPATRAGLDTLATPASSARLAKNCILLHRGYGFLHRGTIILHRGCIIFHKGCIILLKGCLILHKGLYDSPQRFVENTGPVQKSWLGVGGALVPTYSSQAVLVVFVWGDWVWRY